MFRVIRCGQCRWLRSSLRVSPAVAGGHGAGPRQAGQVFAQLNDLELRSRTSVRDRIELSTFR